MTTKHIVPRTVGLAVIGLAGLASYPVLNEHGENTINQWLASFANFFVDTKIEEAWYKHAEDRATLEAYDEVMLEMRATTTTTKKREELWLSKEHFEWHVDVDVD